MAKKFELKPELKDILYWVHVVLIGFVVTGLLNLFGIDFAFTVMNMIKLIAAVVIADVATHTMLQLD